MRNEFLGELRIYHDMKFEELSCGTTFVFNEGPYQVLLAGVGKQEVSIEVASPEFDLVISTEIDYCHAAEEVVRLFKVYKELTK